jgi:tripartite-type tricarboxylate transporter receptor subunit TctC
MTASLRATLFCAAALVLGAAPLYAQTEYPTKPVRIVHGFTAGGISDLLARSIGARLQASMGQPFVVEARSGAGTTIASDHIAKAAPDGYAIFLQDMTTHAINASLYQKLPYDSVRDFTPITLIAASPLILVVHPSLPARSVNELIALATKRPGEIAYGSSGNGTIVHLAGEMFSSMAGVKMVHVPYKGSPQAITGLLGGEIGLIFATLPPALPQVAAGKARALAVTTPERTGAAQDVPTMKEAGLKDFELVLYTGILAPAGVPRPIVERLNGEFAKAVQLPEVQQIYRKVGAMPITSTPEEFAAHLNAEMAKLGKLVKLSGARVQ